ncbi:methyltransferase-like protein 2 isoform X7 [Manihot esculenta]|uniref:methyltransferase-like protein 2 isoform X7 n=1 Tax=Manihot esculenta TaxID=3983 RepID=UPI000B5D12EC|nr:methyltransferase-like protein 2 isoform X7 [Manihot esculenta]
MEESKTSDRLSVFLDSGIYRFENSNVVFIDPVRVLNLSYNRHRVSPTAYYSRFFHSKCSGQDRHETKLSSSSKKRKRREKKPHSLNERERAADQRHRQARPMLLKALECLLTATDLLAIMRNLRSESCPFECREAPLHHNEHALTELCRVWQAPLYEITLNFPKHHEPSKDVAESDCGFNLIVVDPPWENASASQKLLYPTLPNRYFLSLPIKQLAHIDGALIALWVTNREKLRNFVEKELFPSWGAHYAATFYWLKVKADGSLISDLDLFHHRPYECLLLGYCHGKGRNSEHMSSWSDKVIISIPGDYSRKPPIGELLLEHVPGPKHARCIELFAREMIGGWTSWGNEPLHFQKSSYFVER